MISERIDWPICRASAVYQQLDQNAAAAPYGFVPESPNGSLYTVRCHMGTMVLLNAIPFAEAFVSFLRYDVRWTDSRRAKDSHSALVLSRV